MILPDESVVASLMFHSIGLDKHEWPWRAELAEPREVFEGKLRLMREKGFSTAFWDSVYQHMAGTLPLKPRTLMITLDDGYLDNWVFVLPLLRRYGMRATVFVSTEFIEPDGPPRPTLEDVWAGRIADQDLQIAGFLRPSEIKAMADSGLIDIQSHAGTHTWLFNGPRVVDVYSARKYRRLHWLCWNARPERKPFYLTEDQTGFVAEGTPVFQHAGGIIARRFDPDPQSVEEFRNRWLKLPPDATGPEAARCRALAEQLHPGGIWPGQVESEDAHAERLRAELGQSRQLLSRLTGRPVDYLCWPAGIYDDVALRVAGEVGFKAYALGSRDQPAKRNRPGEDPTSLKRISTENRLIVRGVDCGDQPPVYQWLRVRAHQRSLACQIRVLAFKLFALTRTILSGHTS